MKYVVTDEDVLRACVAYNPISPEWVSKSAMRAALESFAQTLGEPVTYSVTPLSDVVLLRSLIEDVEDMHPTVRSQLAHLATRIERGVNIGSTRCRKCGEVAEVSIHSAAPHHPAAEKGCE